MLFALALHLGSTTCGLEVDLEVAFLMSLLVGALNLLSFVLKGEFSQHGCLNAFENEKLEGMQIRNLHRLHHT